MREMALIVLMSVACAGNQTTAPSSTAPATGEGSTDAEGTQIREYMWALAGEVRALDEELAFQQTNDADTHAITAKLERIRAIADDLESDNRAFGHPLITQGLSRFKEQVDFALASAGDPSFMNAGKVIGACATCHDVRACPFDSYSRCVELEAPGS